MKKLSLLLILVLAGCQNSVPQKDEPSRFEKVIILNDTVIKDKKTSLMWAESYGSNGQKSCQAHHKATNEQNDKLLAKQHCQNLQFAGFSDWRVPTASEMQEYIRAMEKAGLKPYYEHPSCPRVFAINNTEAVTINTRNRLPVGAITKYEQLLKESGSSFGVKCVR